MRKPSMTPTLAELVTARNFPAALKLLDIEVAANQEDRPALSNFLCNRAYCFQQMDLQRKALKNYEDALRANPNNILAQLNKGKVLKALDKQREAVATWQKALKSFSAKDSLELLPYIHALIQNPNIDSARPTVNGPAASKPRVNGPTAANGSAPGHAPPATPLASAAPKAQPASKARAQSNGSAPGSRRNEQLPDPSIAVGLAVAQINEGKVDAALSLLDEAINSSSSPNIGAHVARGTARALKRELEGAVEDFTVAIELCPAYGDSWKRRGQARSALPDPGDEALEDFKRARDLVTSSKEKADIQTEMAMLYQKKYRDLRQARRELESATRLDGSSATAWNQLGLCRTGMGDISDGVAAYRRAIALQPQMLDAWFNMAQAYKEAARNVEAEEAFKEVFKLISAGQHVEHIYRVYAHMCQGLGEHMKGVETMNKALESAQGGQRVDCLFLRGACYHAMGYHRKAYDDYTAAFVQSDDSFSEDSKTQQILAFFQRELVLYARSVIDKPVDSYSLDRDIDPVFKELWCKKVPPSTSQFSHCRHNYPSLPDTDPQPPPLPNRGEVARLLATADEIGLLLQNQHQGFLPNKRQQRMGGLAAIELAQAVRHLLAERAAGRTVMVSGKGSTSSGEPHPYGWRDAMDIVVKWRQLSEPNDQVLWVDLLTTKEFEAGFGSHTPMYSGQTKCVRYYMNFERAMAICKRVLLEEGKAYNAQSQPIPLGGQDKRDAIAAARTAEELWQVIGDDSWSVVPIQSTLHPDLTLEGTRLTLVKVPNQPHGYEFSIRTPVTPARWKQFDEELDALWEKVLDALASGEGPQIAVAAITYCYYWYNFMPLARGTAASGYVTLLALFLAADMPITARIPQDYQVDWEAILNRNPAAFIASLSPWFLPPEARPPDNNHAHTAGNADLSGMTARPTSQPGSHPGGPQAVDELASALINGSVLDNTGPVGLAAEGVVGNARPASLVEALPSVQNLLPTLRNRLEVLNGPKMRRI